LDAHELTIAVKLLPVCVFANQY